MPVSLLVLGGFKAYRDGAEIKELPAQVETAATFVYLGIEGQASRDSISQVLWPARDPVSAGNALERALYQLEALLGPGCLEAEGDLLRLTDQVTIDAKEFQKELERGAHAEALNLYRGQFLKGFDMESEPFLRWVRQRARLLKVQFDQACRELVRQGDSAGDLAGALAVAQRWVELGAGEAEQAQHELIRLLLATGQRSQAIRHYEAYERMLAAAGLEPGAEIKALLEHVGAGDESAAAAEGGPAPSGASPISTRMATRRMPGVAASGPRFVRVLEGSLEGDTLFPDDPLFAGIQLSISIEPAQSPSQRGDVRLLLEGTGSRGRFFVRIDETWPLAHGDVFAAGKQLFRFERGGTEKPEDPQPPGSGRTRSLI